MVELFTTMRHQTGETMFNKAFFLSLCIAALAASVALAQDLDQKKQTSLGKYVTAAEALQMVRTDPIGTPLVDIRPVAAYYYLGHPLTAYNVPFLFWTGKWNPEKNVYIFNKNAKFAQAMSAKFAKDKKILILSKAGVRSAQAIEVLAQAGFTNVYSITDGFDAWEKLPDNTITRKLDPGLIYQKPE